jgi:hypothetical protein
MSVGLFKSLLKLPSHIKHEGAIFELCIRKSNSKTRDEFEILYHITDCEDNSAHSEVFNKMGGFYVSEKENHTSNVLIMIGAIDNSEYFQKCIDEILEIIEENKYEII